MNISQIKDTEPSHKLMSNVSPSFQRRHDTDGGTPSPTPGVVPEHPHPEDEQEPAHQHECADRDDANEVKKEDPSEAIAFGFLQN